MSRHVVLCGWCAFFRLCVGTCCAVVRHSMGAVCCLLRGYAAWPSCCVVVSRPLLLFAAFCAVLFLVLSYPGLCCGTLLGVCVCVLLFRALVRFVGGSVACYRALLFVALFLLTLCRTMCAILFGAVLRIFAVLRVWRCVAPVRRCCVRLSGVLLCGILFSRGVVWCCPALLWVLQCFSMLCRAVLCRSCLFLSLL